MAAAFGGITKDGTYIISYQRHSRVSFLRTLFRALEEHGICYCVLHSYEELPDELLGDLDLAIHPSDVAKLPPVFQHLREQGYPPVQCLQYGARGYYVIFAWWEAQGPSLIAVDISDEHRGWGLVLARGESLVAARQRRGEFWVSDPSTEFMYLLAKKTLKGSVPERQSRRLKLLAEALGRQRAERAAEKLFGKKWAVLVVEACAKGSIGDLIQRLKGRLWWTTIRHDPLNPVRYLLADVRRLVDRWLRPTGLFLAVLGPDGVGKSTLISRLSQIVRPAFLRHRVFYWRPRLVWRKKQASPVIHPHEKPLYPAWFSVVRLCVHLVDYWLGYWLMVRPLLVRSALIVFDRYYPDMLVDPRRYRYSGPQSLLHAMCPLIPKPDLVLVMDAPEEIIFSRKQEVTLKEVRRQRQTFLGTANAFAPACCIDASQSMPQVTEEAARTLIALLDRRFQQRYPSFVTIRERRPHKVRLGQNGRDARGDEVLQKALSKFVGDPRDGDASRSASSLVASTVSAAQAKRVVEEIARNNYTRVHCFAALPSCKSPRWLLPVGTRPATLAGLQIYAPYKPRARMLKALLARAIAVGWQGWARHRTFIAAREPLLLESLVHEVAGESRPVFVLSLGTPGLYRKLTIQVMRPNGEILGYIKLPLTGPATERVRHEAAVLERLSNFAVLQPHLPKVLHAGKWGDAYILFQSHGPPGPGPIEFGRPHEEFLQALWSVHRVARPGHVLVEEAAARWQEAVPLLDHKLQELGHHALIEASQGLDGTMITCGITHGDFAPWNTRTADGHLFLLDWEWAIWDAPTLWDLFHFDVQVASLLQRRGGAELHKQRTRAERGIFLLYLLSSLCRVAKERVPGNRCLAYRRRLLIDQLSKRVAKHAS